MVVDESKKKEKKVTTGSKRKGAGTSLNDAFIGFFAVAFLLSLSLNVLHEMGNFDNKGDRKSHDLMARLDSSTVSKTKSALHRAMADFVRHGKDSSSAGGGGGKPVTNLSAQDLAAKHQNAPHVKKTPKNAVDTSSGKDDNEEEGDRGTVEHENEHDSHGVPEEILQQHHHADNMNNNKPRDDLMKLAELDCKVYERPSHTIKLTEEETQEMVYWQDIPSDSTFSSPFLMINDEYAATTGVTRYLTFEPDGGGWNNIRMSMESVIALAVAMGRTLVMPPQKKMYLLGKNEEGQQHHFSFADFFPIKEMAKDNDAFEVVTMDQYLEHEGMGGKLKHRETGKVLYPPGNRTNWDGINQDEYDLLRAYLRNVSTTAKWSPGQCLPAFPASGNHKDVEHLKSIIPKADQLSKTNKPPPISAPDPVFRLGDTLAGRKELCVYDEKFQNEQIIHFQMNHKEKLRLLVHFYAFIFFEDWREDLWMQRFVRDHLRYIDEIQCAAARVVAKLRKHVKSRQDGHSDPDGNFDSFHIRRGDFQFKTTRISAEEIVKNSEAELTLKSTIFIATDERDKKFFQPMRDRYDIWFLDDFKDELEGVNTNYYGMIDQLVASKGRIFFGCFFSTFTGYINRLRGYHSIKDKTPGYEDGLLPTTYYYATIDKKTIMHEYSSIRGGFFNREYARAWRGIDNIEGIERLQDLQNIDRWRDWTEQH